MSHDLLTDLRLLTRRCPDPRAAVSALVSQALGPDARVGHTPQGAPLICGVPSPPSLSVSHSRALAAVLLGPGDARIGVDAEEWRDQLARVMTRLLSPQERAAYGRGLPLLMAWTAKEAVYKAALTPGLSLHEIMLPLPAAPNPGEEYVATARGHGYRLVSTLEGPTMLTRALRIQNSVKASGSSE